MPSMLDSIEGTATTVEQAAGIPSLKSSLGSGLGVTSTVAVQFTRTMPSSLNTSSANSAASHTGTAPLPEASRPAVATTASRAIGSRYRASGTRCARSRALRWRGAASATASTVASTPSPTSQ